jgi:DNA phosphorothioation-dependent restriction protein DptG
MEFDKLMKYQDMVQNRLRKEQNLDRKIDLLSIINQLTAGPKNLVQKEQILVETSARGITFDQANDLLEKLIEERVIIENPKGFIRKR